MNLFRAKSLRAGPNVKKTNSNWPTEGFISMASGEGEGVGMGGKDAESPTPGRNYPLLAPAQPQARSLPEMRVPPGG